MNLQRVLLALAPTCVALAACGSAEPSNPDGAGGSATIGGATSGGSATSGAGASGTTNGTAGGAPTGGASAGGVSAGGAPTSGASGAGGGIVGMAGSGGGITTGGTAGAGGAPPGASTEDDGADCPVSALPDAASLPTIAKLPDPFTKLDGTRMTTKAEWRCRREEIKKLAEKFAYGTKPPKPQTVTGTVTNSTLTVKVTDNGKTTTFSMGIKLPTSGTAPYPAIVVYGGASFGAPLDPAVINSEGVALINYDPYAVGKEGTPRNNKQGAFYDIAGSNSTTGLLVAWGWGVSRIIDVIEQSDGKILQANAVGVTGCSRFGKGSFIAGVFDQRIPLTMPIESGTAGVPIWRGVNAEGGQTLSSAYGEQPWFGDAFSAFTGSPTKAPIDTHESVAMIAPRGLFIMDNPHIANLGPKSASVAALAAAEVYKALGAGDNITYYSDVQNGSHCSMRPEWSAPLKSNIEKFLKKTGNAAGVMKISSSASGDLSSWRDWQTPTLN
jgi:glucuronyl esterase-like protein